MYLGKGDREPAMIVSNRVAGSGVGGNDRHEHDDAVRGKHPCHPANPGHIDVTILATVTQAGGEVRPHLVTVQHLHPLARAV